MPRKPKPERLALHVLPNWKHEGGWLIKFAGKALYLHRDAVEIRPYVFGLKKDAISIARRFAKGHLPSQLIIHKRNGMIQTEYTYGGDPFPPKG